MGEDETDVCDYSLAIDGDITGGGTPIEGVEGQATHGAEIVEILTGEDLEAGVHRLWIYCEDADGDLGRTSFSYEYSGLAAPSGFALDPGDGDVVVSWTHDGSSTGYRLRFSDSSFAASEDPTFCNADNSFCSPYELSVDGAGDDDDDDSSSASDDDDSAGDSLAAGETLSVTIGGLVNGTRHYFALVAIDSVGSEGPSTDVLYATPNVLGGAAALAGDIGGCACNSSSPTGAPLPVFLLLGLFLRSRRRTQGPNR
jgi:MYXO-CTERM domain-containing protein